MANDLNAFIGELSANKDAVDSSATALIDTQRNATEVGGLGIFAQTALESIPALIGIEESPEVVEFRRQHPIQALAADIIGTTPVFAAPFLAPIGAAKKVKRVGDLFTAGKTSLGLRAASKTPLLKKLVQEGFEESSAPLAAIAKREFARFAPFEAARVLAGAGAELSGEDDAFATTLTAAGFDLLAIPAATAASTAFLRSVGRRTGVAEGTLGGKERLFQDSVPDFDLQDSIQSKLKIVNGFLSEAVEDTVGTDVLLNARSLQGELRKSILEEAPKQGRAFVQKLTGDNSARTISSYFTSSGNRNAIRLDKLSETKFLDTLRRAEVGDKFLETAQFPRLMTFKNKEASRKFQESIRSNSNITRLNSKWYMAEEKNGLFVMLKKVKGREVPGTGIVPGDNDEFLLFKALDPREFVPTSPFAGDLLSRTFAVGRELKGKSYINKIPYGKNIVDLFDVMLPKSIVRPGLSSRAKQVNKLLNPGQREIFEEARKSLNFSKEQFKEFLAPAIHEFTDEPLASDMFNYWRHGMAMAYKESLESFRGLPVPKNTTSAFRRSVTSQEFTPSIKTAIDDLTEEALEQVNDAFSLGLSIDDMKERGFLPQTLKLFERMLPEDNKRVNWLASLDELSGDNSLILERQLANQFSLPHRMAGNYRVQIIDEGDRLVHVASGFSSKQAINRAKKIQGASAGKLKIKLADDGNLFSITDSRVDDTKLLLQLDDSIPGYTTAENIVAQLVKNDPEFRALGLDKKRLAEQIFGTYIDIDREIGGRILRNVTAPELEKLGEISPKLLRQLESRFSAMAGKKGKFASQVDRSINRHLEPFLGANAASDIASAANRTLFTLTLGMGDLGFAAMNAMSFVQTAIPELALLTSAPGARLAGKYTSNLVASPKGGLHVVHKLSPMKVLHSAFKSLRKPDDELLRALDRAVDENVINQQLLEEILPGVSSTTRQRFQDALAGKNSVPNFLLQLSEWLPAKSERFSRMMSFGIGWELGKMRGLQGEALFQLAREFTANTNFLYGTADRARVITGSMGSTFGLFKNWQMHFIGNLMRYFGEGVSDRNWAPLLWYMASSGTIAGTGGLALSGAADSLSRVLSDDGLMVNAYNAMGYTGAPDEDTRLLDSVFFGMPALLGVTLQSRAASPTSNIMLDLDQLTSVAAFDRAEAMGEALGKGVDWMKATGRSPFKSQQFRDSAARAVLPRTFYRAMQITEDGAVRSLRTGNKLTGDLGALERTAFFLGMTPVEVEKAYELNTEITNAQEDKRTTVQNLGERLYQIQISGGDPVQTADVLRRGIQEGILPDSILRSYIARAHNRLVSQPVKFSREIQKDPELGFLSPQE